MCLAMIDGKKPPKTGSMWKVFERASAGGDKLKSAYIQYCSMPRGRWLKAQDKSEVAVSDLDYPFGFHGWKTKAGAEADYEGWGDPENYMIIRVRYRSGHTQGTQDGFPAIVAGQIFISKSRGKTK